MDRKVTQQEETIASQQQRELNYTLQDPHYNCNHVKLKFKLLKPIVKFQFVLLQEGLVYFSKIDRVNRNVV